LSVLLPDFALHLASTDPVVPPALGTLWLRPRIRARAPAYPRLGPTAPRPHRVSLGLAPRNPVPVAGPHCEDRNGRWPPAP
jgi:hypothetical protein